MVCVCVWGGDVCVYGGGGGVCALPGTFFWGGGRREKINSRTKITSYPKSELFFSDFYQPPIFKQNLIMTHFVDKSETFY